LNKIILDVLFIWLKIFCTFLVLGFLTKTIIDVSRFEIIIWAISSLSLILLNHVGLRFFLRLLRNRGKNFRSSIYYGEIDGLHRLNNQLRAEKWMGIKNLGYFTNNSEAKKVEQSESIDEKYLGGYDEFIEYLKSNSVDIVFCGISQRFEQKKLIRDVGDNLVTLIFMPLWSTTSMNLKITPIGKELFIKIWGEEANSTERLIKRLCDFTVSFLAIIFLMPIFIVLGILIKLESKGPALYIQERYGIDGKSFLIYKFRTMLVTESGRKVNLKQVKANDQRITRIGHFLRRWSLDELPQLFNVFLGNMSFVGPRPHAISHNEEYRKLIMGYMQRHNCKPGITGLAQVRGYRGFTTFLDMQNRVDSDLEYLKKRSLLFDLFLLLRTISSLKIMKGL